MVKKGKMITNNDYLCSCGALLHNTCKSAIKKHKNTKRHNEKLKALYKGLPTETLPEKMAFKKIITVITFD